MKTKAYLLLLAATSLGLNPTLLAEGQNFTIKATAFQNVFNQTDLTIAIDALKDSIATPSASTHLQLKSYDTAGEVRWTKNYTDVPLVNGVAGLSFDDLQRWQKVNVQAQVQVPGISKQEVLRSATTVLLKPDLDVMSVNVGGNNRINRIINISATINELNGDLGGSAKAYLVNGESVLDVADIQVLPFGMSGVVFSTTFSEAGTYPLRIVIAEGIPSDFDESNNVEDFSLTVAPEASLVASYTQYEYSQWDADFSYYNSAWGTERFVEKGSTSMRIMKSVIGQRSLT